MARRASAWPGGVLLWSAVLAPVLSGLAVAPLPTSAPPSGCLPAPLRGFIRREGAHLVDDTGGPFRFISINVPNLHRIEVKSSLPTPPGVFSVNVDNFNARAPSKDEIYDALCSVRQLGGRATRMYVLSHGPTDAYHVGPGGELNNRWFKVIDTILAVAHELGVRLIIPFVNTAWIDMWGSTSYYAGWAGEDDSSYTEFFYSSAQRDVFKAMISRVLTRNNTITGKMYADEEAILAWELGNELHDPKFPTDSMPPPNEWTADIARHIKSIDANHLVMDGGQFTPAVLQVSEIDMVGSTLYGRLPVAVADQADAVGEWNDESEPEAQKVFLLKEFGLVHQTPDVPVQDLNWVDAVLHKVTKRPWVAGAMYWSLRFHADEGGFYHFTEFGKGDIKALHWPGFSTGAPNYEIEVFDMLQLAGRNVTGNKSNVTWTSASVRPCSPVLLSGGKVAHRVVNTCLNFTGAAGAAQYELWAKADATDRWQVLMENVTDFALPQSASISVDPSVLARAFPDVTTGTRRFWFCVRACSQRLNLRPENLCFEGGAGDPAYCQTYVHPSCSGCSEPVGVWVDLEAAPSPCDSSGHFVDHSNLWFDWYYGLFNYNTVPDGIIPTLCVLLAVATALSLAWWAESRSAAKRGDAPSQAVEQLRSSTGERLASLDVLRIFMVSHLALHQGVKHGWFGDLPEPVTNFAAWGVAEFPFLFAHAGFVAGVRYAPRATTLEVWPFFLQRWMRMYPAYAAFSLATLIAGFWQGLPITGRYIHMFPFCAHAWRPDIQFEGLSGEVSWVIGPLLVQAAFTLPLLSRMQECSTSAVRTILAGALALTVWQACHYLQIRVFVLDDVVTWMALRGYAPSFVAGAALGVLFGRCYGEEGGGSPSDGDDTSAAALRFVERYGASVAVVMLGALWGSFAGPRAFSAWPLAEEWASHGLFLPVQCVALWAAAAGTDVMTPFVHWVGVALQNLSPWLWLYVPIGLHFTFHCVGPLREGDDPIMRIATFAVGMVALAVSCESTIRQPVVTWAERVKLDPSSFGLLPAQLGAPTRAEGVFLFYGGLVSVLLTFAWFALDEDHMWATLVTIPDGPVSAVLETISLLLYVPAWALGMGLAGMCLYPPVLSKDPVPIARQLQEARLAGETPFRLAFRIVTRGNSPNLVFANVQHAYAVLSKCLPRERWTLEVVNDIPLHLETLNLPVKELLVPESYKPPGGCLFKARALQYAVLASEARREDWVIHLDEETRFDADTVAHILEHCRAQHTAVMRGEQRYAHIGQGVIVYNIHSQVNLLCTLADTIRVADDFGKFAMQYRLFEQPLIGMHGSFVVCPNSVEMDVGFDYGVPGSITEDTFFAMKAAASGVHVTWCGGHMFEQSPFGVHDFAKQRCRWFAGLWLCVRDTRLPRLHRVVLGSHVASWALCPFLLLLAWTNWFCNMTRPGALRVSLAVVYAVPLWGYVLGFFWTFQRAYLRHGAMEYLMLLFMQVMGVPIYAGMEAYGVALALYTRPFEKFELVQKEGGTPDATAPKTKVAAQKVADEPPQKLVQCLAKFAGEGSLDEVALLIYDEGVPVKKRNKEAKVEAAVLNHAINSMPSAVEEGVPVQFQAKFPPLAPQVLSDVSRGVETAPKHWAEVFDGASHTLEVPFRNARGELAAGTWESISLPVGTTAALQRIAEAGPTGTGVLDAACAAIGLTVSLHCGEENFIIGIEMHMAAQQLGHAVLPQRVSIDQQASLPQLAGNQQQQRMASEAVHLASGCPSLATVLRHGGEAWEARSTSGLPPLQFAVVSLGGALHNSAEVCLTVPAVATTDDANDPATEPKLTYHTSFFEKSAIKRWCIRLAHLAQGAATELNVRMCQLPLMSTVEARLVSAFSGKMRPFKDTPLHMSFLAQAAATPLLLAATQGKDALTYAELAAAARLVASGVQAACGDALREQRHALVGLLFERSNDVLAVIYGVLIAGAGYLPMDPEFPPGRIEDMLTDAGVCCPLVLVESAAVALKVPVSFTGKVACASRHGVVLPSVLQTIVVTPSVTPRTTAVVPPLSTEGLVYVMYTSGTTGRPKGVMVHHHALTMRNQWMLEQFDIGPGARVPMKTPYIFGISEWEVFLPLTGGAAVVICPTDSVRTVAALTQLMEVQECTHGFFVPSHLAALLQHWRTLPGPGPRKTFRWVGCCGEVLPGATVREFHDLVPGADIYNFYGPTEGSMSWRKCLPEDPSDAAALIGRPVDNTTMLLLDRWGRAVPVGVPGEIHFGHCMALGYLNQPEQTKEKFITNPLSSTGFLSSTTPPCPIVYRTGDLAMWLDSGEMKYMGRADRQVKVRGYRIELGAVEEAMREAGATLTTTQGKPPLQGACCVALPASAQRRGGELVGFVEVEYSDSDLKALRELMGHRLPVYMVPSRLIAKRAFKTLASGKVDIKALQAEAAAESTQPGDESFATAGEAQPSEMLEDSLGQARKFAGAANAVATETRIADNLRAFFMYGVIFDHWAGCTESGMCQLVMEGIIWHQPDFMRMGLRNMEVILRSIGNYKGMSGFMMVSAYMDSGYADAAHFSKADVVVILVYFHFLWVLDPLIYAVCSEESPQWCTPSWNMFEGVHRWYMLVVLVIKVALVFFRVTRMPPLAQCTLLTFAVFLMPSSVGCITDAKFCVEGGDHHWWREYITPMEGLWRLIFHGVPYDPSKQAFTSIVMRYYVLFMAQYFWVFHYGRSVVAKVTEFLRAAAPTQGAKKWWRLSRVAAFAIFLVMELTMTGLVGPMVFTTMQKDASSEILEPDLVQLWGIIIALSAEVALLAYAMSALPWRFKMLGSTTLGCYMIHLYFVYPIMLVRDSFISLSALGPGGAVLQVLIMLAAPALFQLTIGIAFHKLLMWEQQALLGTYTWAHAVFSKLLVWSTKSCSAVRLAKTGLANNQYKTLHMNAGE